MTDTSTANSRGLIRSMMIIGSTQVVNITLSIFRQKMLAVLLGPSGIGLLSLYTSLQGMVTQVAGLGMGNSGVREIAAARDDAKTLSRVKLVLLLAHLVQGSLAMGCVWFLRDRIAVWIFQDAGYAINVGLVGIAILLALLAAAHTALLQGLRRIGDLGRVTVLGAFAGTVVGLAAVVALGQAGLIWFVLAQPLFNLIAARWFVARMQSASAPAPRLRDIPSIWLPMARLGFAFMLGGLMTTATLLVVRSQITQSFGLEAAGQFAAAWGITMTYVGFLLSAMSADYYPRLTEVITDKPAAVALMNDQAQLGLAIGGPVLLVMIGWAPWVISLLYSREFLPAVELLQWQSAGNILKLASWSLSFSVVAAAKAKTYVLLEASFNIVFLALIFLLLPRYGLTIAATAFVAGYIIYFATAYLLARNLHRYRMTSLTRNLLILHVALGCALLILASVHQPSAYFAAPLLGAATGILGLRTVLVKTGPEGCLAGRLTYFFQRAGWPIRTAP
ncbi:hypothetical protein ATO2_17530 [Roseovarius sp. 22II1-1F6A]|nr:hypothetical protein ATO2_17530 [Roseovarius sp. 22II1-1F6A]